MRNEIERDIEWNLDLWDDEKMLTKSLDKEEIDDKIKKFNDERKALTKKDFERNESTSHK